MKRLVVISAALAALALSTLTQAQTPPASSPAASEPVSPETLALAREVFRISNTRQMMDSMDAMIAGMSRNVAGKLADPQTQRMTAFRKAMSEEMQATFIPRLVDQMSEAYARTFTAEELRGILAFYRTPTGEAMIQKTPALMQHLVPAMMQDVPDLMRGAITRYCTENTCSAQERAAFDKTLAGMPGPHG